MGFNRTPIKKDYSDFSTAVYCFKQISSNVVISKNKARGICPLCKEETFYLWPCENESFKGYRATCSRKTKCDFIIKSSELFSHSIEDTLILMEDYEETEFNPKFNNKILCEYLSIKCRPIELDSKALEIANMRLLDKECIMAQFGKIIIPVINLEEQIIGLKVYDPEETPKYKWKSSVKLDEKYINLSDIPSEERFIGLEKAKNKNIPIFLTEGVFDAHNFEQGISYDSSSLSISKINFIQNKLSGFKLYWLLDRDIAGNSVYIKLKTIGIKDCDILITPKPYKDANEMAVKLNKKILNLSDLEQAN